MPQSSCCCHSGAPLLQQCPVAGASGGSWRRRELAEKGVGGGGNWRRRELAGRRVGGGGSWRKGQLAGGGVGGWGGVGGGGSRSCSRPHRREGSCVPYISSCEISLLTLMRHRVGSRWLVKVVVRPGVATNGSGQRLKSGASYFCVCTSQQTASELPLTCVLSS